jgi:hypothetical protein
MDEIATMPSLEPPPQQASRLPSRLQHAIDRVRWHVCGVFGIKAIDVSDAHAAEFVTRIDDDYLFRVLPGVGIQTEDDLRAWAVAERERPTFDVQRPASNGASELRARNR